MHQKVEDSPKERRTRDDSPPTSTVRVLQASVVRTAGRTAQTLPEMSHPKTIRRKEDEMTHTPEIKWAICDGPYCCAMHKAAPDMLAALEKVITQIEIDGLLFSPSVDLFDTIYAARAAIARAKGEVPA